MAGRVAQGALLGAAILCSAGLQSLPSTAAADPTSWSVVATPNPGAGENSLASVSCPTSSFCMAVGTSAQTSHATLAERWDGASWSVTDTPTPSPGAQLLSVSCPSPSFCMAVGHTDGGYKLAKAVVVEVWDGTQWTLAPSPTPLTSYSTAGRRVACASPSFCIEVGAVTTPTITDTQSAVWDGSAWTTLTPPDPSRAYNLLDGLSCSAPNFCVAVGDFRAPNELGVGPIYNSMVLQWDGTSWSMADSPNASAGTINSPMAVSCPSATSCVAVGNAKVTDLSGEVKPYEEIYTWDGSTWSLLLSPELVDLAGISCVDAAHCAAVGSGPAVGVLSWDGTSWLPVDTTGLPGGQVQLTSVSCPSAAFCMAVGGNQSSAGSLQTIAETGSLTAATPSEPPTSPSSGTGTDTPTTTSTPTSTTTAAGTSTRGSTRHRAARTSGGSASSNLLWAGVGAGVVAVLGGLIGLALWLRRRPRSGPSGPQPPPSPAPAPVPGPGSFTEPLVPPQFLESLSDQPSTDLMSQGGPPA